eukprot:CAMPEP_0114662630 /NCGR_PEP_ID=MMETSP0191-20121206/25215_1 /TAXON_ID=126664 /ORGANISM="Sorites sp." /LENGTH=139 /DNA_ID=CAMNT_0001899395 /DNA_START=55 /DNA_END=471 /DNA_ORIENTATION=-
MSVEGSDSDSSVPTGLPGGNQDGLVFLNVASTTNNLYKKRSVYEIENTNENDSDNESSSSSIPTGLPGQSNGLSFVPVKTNNNNNNNNHNKPNTNNISPLNDGNESESSSSDIPTGLPGQMNILSFVPINNNNNNNDNN